MEPFPNHPSGRRNQPIHSIPYSVAQPLERGFNNYYSIIQGESYERQEAHRLQLPVRGAECADGGGAAPDGAVPRDWPPGLWQVGEGRGGGGCGISAQRLSRQFRLLSPEPAADAGLLPCLRHGPGGAARGHVHRLDTERGHPGGGADAPGQAVVYSGGTQVRVEQSNAGGEDRVRRPSGDSSRLGSGSMLYWGKQYHGVCKR